MLIYEVTVTVDAAIEADFLEWLRAHIVDMAGLEEIQEARLFRSLEEDGDVVFVSQYRMASRQAYESYLEHHAVRMRGDAKERFGDQFSASRRVLEEC